MRQTDFSPGIFCGQAPMYHAYYNQQPISQAPPAPPPPPTIQASSHYYPQSHHTHHQHTYSSLSSMDSTATLVAGSCRAGDQEEDNIWMQVERRMYAGLESNEQKRRYCAYCGVKEDTAMTADDRDSSAAPAVLLGRCYGCQLTYYCSQEHQHLDWLQSHMPRCAELEWVGLCELVQATQITLPLPGLGQFWTQPCNSIATWTDWFEMRTDLVKCAHLVAKTMEQNLWHKQQQQQRRRLPSKLNRREPTAGELVDGLLAQVTDSMTYALTLGDAIRRYTFHFNTHLKISIMNNGQYDRRKYYLSRLRIQLLICKNKYVVFLLIRV